MMLRMGVIWILSGLALCIGVFSQQTTYKAAIVQIKPPRNNADLPAAVIRHIAEALKTYIDRAKANGANIIVFPEYGLTTLEPVKEQLHHLEPFSVSFKIGDDPCLNTSSEALKTVSCAAKSNGIYVVLNVLEKAANNDFFNTDLVFSNQGIIIKSYRKRNLQNEAHYMAGEADETFEMNIGGKTIKLGMITGSDILHKSSLKVGQEQTDVVFTTALESDFPFFNGLSLQLGFALSYDVNLLASSYYSLENGITGSGIYHHNGNVPKIVSFNDSSLIIADVPIRSQKEYPNFSHTVNILDSLGSQLDIPSFHYTVLNTSTFITESITVENLKTKKCTKDGNTCCHITADFVKNPAGKYELATYEGSQATFGIKNGTDVTVFICHVITTCFKSGNNGCNEDMGPSILKKLEIGLDVKENSLVLPILLTKDFKPINNAVFSRSEKEKPHISLKAPETNIPSVIYMGYYVIPSSSNNLVVSNIVIMLIFLLRIL